MEEPVKENDSTSTSSRNSKHSSSRSGMSSLIAQAKAKLEAAKARLRFAEMESDLKRKQAVLDQQMALDEAKVKREKAELSVNLELLAQQRETAALAEFLKSAGPTGKTGKYFKCPVIILIQSVLMTGNIKTTDLKL